MKVIALKGPSNSGKTRTLNIVYQLLLNMGYTQVPGHFLQPQPHNFLGDSMHGLSDFLDVLVHDGHKIGITTGEESESQLKQNLLYFEKAGCTKAICTCPDDMEDINIIKKYEHVFIDKTSQPVNSLKRINDGAFASKIVGAL